MNILLDIVSKVVNLGTKDETVQLLVLMGCMETIVVRLVDTVLSRSNAIT